MGRHWVPDRPLPRKRDLREAARFRLVIAANNGPVPDAGIRIAVRSGVPIDDVARLTGKTTKEVQQIMEASQQAQQAPSEPYTDPVDADQGEAVEDTGEGYSPEDLLGALFTEQEIAAKASAHRAAGNVDAANVLDQYHAERVEEREQREADADED